MEHLAAKETDISLRRWWRPKTELKEGEYWTHIHQVAQTRLQMIMLLSNCCGNKQLFANKLSISTWKLMICQWCVYSIWLKLWNNLPFLIRSSIHLTKNIFTGLTYIIIFWFCFSCVCYCPACLIFWAECFYCEAFCNFNLKRCCINKSLPTYSLITFSIWWGSKM